jgi:hypothetical protein
MDDDECDDNICTVQCNSSLTDPNFIDRCFVLLDRPKDGSVSVTLTDKKGAADAGALRQMAGEFANELLTQAWRQKIVEENRVLLETVTAVHYILALEFAVMDSIAVGVFTTEYLMRMYSVVEDPKFKAAYAGRAKYAFTPGAIIDAIAVLPFFLEALLHHLFDLRFLRIFRMMRLLKLTRFSDATKLVWDGIRREAGTIGASFFVMLLVIIVFGAVGYLFEHAAQPDKIDSIPTSIYWSVITLGSVGYGDISPITPMGRIVASLMALLGIALIAIPSGILAAAFTDQLRIEREKIGSKIAEVMEDDHIDAEPVPIGKVCALPGFKVHHVVPHGAAPQRERRTARLSQQGQVQAEAAVGGFGAADGLEHQIHRRALLDGLQGVGDMGQHAGLRGDVVAADHRVQHGHDLHHLRHVVTGRIDANHRVAAAIQEAVEHAGGNPGGVVGWVVYRWAAVLTHPHDEFSFVNIAVKTISGYEIDQ